MNNEIGRREVIMPGGTELTKEAEQHGARIDAIDTNVDFIRRAQERASARGLVHLVSFGIGNGNAHRFESSMFDLVFCCGAI